MHHNQNPVVNTFGNKMEFRLIYDDPLKAAAGIQPQMNVEIANPIDSLVNYNWSLIVLSIGFWVDYLS